MKLISSLVIICGLVCPLATGAGENTPKKEIEVNGTNQDFSWMKTQYHSKSLKNYSFGYWINGWKKHKGDTSKNLLCFETGNYGVIFDVDSLDTPQFSDLNDTTNMMSTLASGTSRVASLDPAKLAIEVEQGGKKYRVKTCAKETAELRLKPISTMVSGIYVQRYRIDKLGLFDDAGIQLEGGGSLELVVWPSSLTFTVELSPEMPKDKTPNATVPNWKNAIVSISFGGSKGSRTNKAEIKGDWKSGEKKKLTLNCNMQSSAPQSSDLEIRFSLKEGGDYPVKFEPESNAYVTRVPSLKRVKDMRAPGGHDEFLLEIDNKSSEIKEVPFHMILQKPWANGTSALSTLCYPDGTPTGIVIQGSGTTFNGGAACVLNPYTLIPVKPGKTVFLYRIAYKYYGTVATAYAHQDWVHEPGYARWWQFAIGGAGETMTMDGDHGPTDQSICDVRALYLRKGLKGVTSNWTDAGWGGDWLRAFGEKNQKLVYNDMKSVSLADGPCFTDLRFNGYYGSNRSVRVDSKVSTLRTDDYSRVFFDIRYDFEKTVSAKNASFFNTGSTIGVPKLAYGNLQGLIKETSRTNTNIVEWKEKLKAFNNVVMAGPGPWWVTTPANHRVDKNNNEKRPMGNTSLIIRSVEYNLGGKKYQEPTLRVDAVASNTFEGGQPALGAHTFIVPPVGVTEFKAGDSVHINVEWMTPARIADDYYGPNKALHKWLQENPTSWKTAYREAKGNHLNVDVKGGQLIKNYPLIIKAESSDEIRFNIAGGVGYVPLRFEGLVSSRGYTLYQIINDAELALNQSSPAGNDFWQTEYDAPSNSYRMSYNLCLDDFPVSKWVLKYKKN